MWPGELKWRRCTETSQAHEAQSLKLDCSKSLVRLPWRPKLDLNAALRATADWYSKCAAGEDMREVTLNQIHAYETNGA